MATFDIKIIGAGVAGLGAGLALRRKGHQVTVYESNQGLSEFGAGIQLYPNGTRILSHWGLEKEFRKVANEPHVTKMIRYENGKGLGGGCSYVDHFIKFVMRARGLVGIETRVKISARETENAQQEWDFGYPQWQVFRPDLQRILFNATREAGVHVHFGQKVADVDVEQGTITFADESRRSGDLVIAADGILSKPREKLPGNAGITTISSGVHCFRAVIPKAKMNSDPGTAELMKGEDSFIWLGLGLVVLDYTVSGGEIYNTLISVPYSDTSENPVGRWNEPGDVNEARDLVKDFCSAVRKTWDYVDECVKWTLCEVPKVASYVSNSGKCVIIGDAAHAILPHAGQRGGMALEDCAALADFVSSAKTAEDLAHTMKGFQEFRQPRIGTRQAEVHADEGWSRAGGEG